MADWMADWPAELAARVARDGRAVLVTVAHATGSTPREAGTAMVVTAQDTFGSIGGGHLEFEALRIARDALGNAATPASWLMRFPLAARLGQCCGGVATLAFVAVGAAAGGHNQDWLQAAVAALRNRLPLAVVSRIGGAQQQPAQLLVTAQSVIGSLGNCVLDAAAGALAQSRVMAGLAGAALVDAPADPGVTLLIHVVLPADFTVLVFGNGHVGRALVQVLGALPARVRWIDGRDADFPASVPPNVEIVATDAPEDELTGAPRGAYVVVLTHSHALDLQLIEIALARDDWRYLGLIGSQPKRNQFAKRLAARGFPPAAFTRVTCPIGMGSGPAIRSKEPGAIAVAVAAEMLVLRERAAIVAGTAVPPMESGSTAYTTVGGAG
ncbi:MAG: xanthine dehydrogenase accessory protein XdhC [Casimicrobiaceae bacterium]